MQSVSVVHPWPSLGPPLQAAENGGSHSSPNCGSTTPLPHASQSFGHRSVSTVLPSSHSSGAQVKPSPHVGGLQRVLQPSQLFVLPSSQVSPHAVSTTPLPHAPLLLQPFMQPSQFWVLPSSHTSGAQVTPDPHPVLLWQLL